MPLEDNAFNRAKSDIAALEASVFGAVPIVPDWAEWWSYPVNYSSATYLQELLADLIAGDVAAQVPAPDNRRLSIVNQQRYELLK